MHLVDYGGEPALFVRGHRELHGVDLPIPDRRLPAVVYLENFGIFGDLKTFGGGYEPIEVAAYRRSVYVRKVAVPAGIARKLLRDLHRTPAADIHAAFGKRSCIFELIQTGICLPPFFLVLLRIRHAECLGVCPEDFAAVAGEGDHVEEHHARLILSGDGDLHALDIFDYREDPFFCIDNEDRERLVLRERTEKFVFGAAELSEISVPDGMEDSPAVGREGVVPARARAFFDDGDERERPYGQPEPLLSVLAGVLARGGPGLIARGKKGVVIAKSPLGVHDGGSDAQIYRARGKVLRRDRHAPPDAARELLRLAADGRDDAFRLFVLGAVADYAHFHIAKICLDRFHIRLPDGIIPLRCRQPRAPRGRARIPPRISPPCKRRPSSFS